MLMRFDSFRDWDRLFGQLREGVPTASMPLDAYRKGESFYVELDLPGVNSESIEVTVEKNVLTVKAERHWNDEDAESLVLERPQGTFTRRLFLGDSLDTDKVTASYRDGVLELVVPVAEEAKAHRVEVTSAPEAKVIPTPQAA